MNKIFDVDGREITAERISQYVVLGHKLLNARTSRSMREINYIDFERFEGDIPLLITQALLKFSAHKAINSVTSIESVKVYDSSTGEYTDKKIKKFDSDEEYLAYKRANADKTVARQERSFVMQKIVWAINAFLGKIGAKLDHKFQERPFSQLIDRVDAKIISLDGSIVGHVSDDLGDFGPDNGVVNPITDLHYPDQAQEDYDYLMANAKKYTAVKFEEFFARLTRKWQPKRVEDLKTIFTYHNRRILAHEEHE